MQGLGLTDTLGAATAAAPGINSSGINSSGAIVSGANRSGKDALAPPPGMKGPAPTAATAAAATAAAAAPAAAGAAGASIALGTSQAARAPFEFTAGAATEAAAARGGPAEQAVGQLAVADSNGCESDMALSVVVEMGGAPYDWLRPMGALTHLMASSNSSHLLAAPTSGGTGGPKKGTAKGSGKLLAGVQGQSVGGVGGVEGGGTGVTLKDVAFRLRKGQLLGICGEVGDAALLWGV